MGCGERIQLENFGECRQKKMSPRSTLICILHLHKFSSNEIWDMRVTFRTTVAYTQYEEQGGAPKFQRS